jgi:hypothetical protein
MRFIFTLTVLLYSFTVFSQVNSIDIGIFNNPSGSNKLEIRIKPNQNLSPSGGGYTAGLFTIKFPTTYNASLNVVSSSYGYAQAATNPPVPGPNGTEGGYDYYIFSKVSGSGGTFNANEEYVIAVIEIISPTSGTGTFQIANDTWTDNNNGTYYQEYNTDPANNVIYQATTSAALPIELVEFRATAKTKRSVQLRWTAESEQNLRYYEIERSTDAQQFDVIGKTESEGGLGITAKYLFDDSRPVSGDNHYRLKMTYDDNSFGYSPIRTVQIEDTGISNFRVQPNPTFGPITLSFTADKEMDVKISFTDAKGLLVKTHPFSAQEGKNTIYLDGTTLSAGKYNIALEAPGQDKIVQQVVVSRGY